ncbi:MAG: Glyoxalase/bleomycin resistance protein/dioxygenase [Bryobacterales bacterium]|nr:Glyoxalase/bleomycin resistance protein/dioxygenase [Bryobacterales bacterium]
MSKEILGIHHITAICGEPQTNVDFYAGLLGLRLVKRTVNFDDPKTYHLYYGNGVGTPGTILTFFPWPGVGPGRLGTGQTTATSFAISPGAIPFWTERLSKAGLEFEAPVSRFGEDLLSFSDPDGMQIELITSAAVNPSKAYAEGPIPLEYAIHGFHSATLSEEGFQQTSSLLTETLGFKLLKQEGNRFRFSVGAGEPGTTVDVLVAPDEPSGRVAGGSVHHIAWRTADDAQQLEWLKELTKLGYNSSPVMDRKYFHSIYFREPGGILFEIATDPPGFAIDEPLDQLGSKLVLPPWLEKVRSQLEAVLPPIQLPTAAPTPVTP